MNHKLDQSIKSIQPQLAQVKLYFLENIFWELLWHSDITDSLSLQIYEYNPVEFWYR